MFELASSNSSPKFPLKAMRCHFPAYAKTSTPQCTLSSSNMIKPLPLLRTKLTKRLDLNKKLNIHGYKHFSQVAATGEQSVLLLDDIKRSTCLKFISDFEFDPYLCDVSGLQSLSQVLKKLKLTKKLNIIIRRIQRKHETDLVTPWLPRINHMVKFRIEFPSTPGIIGEDLVRLARWLEKCLLLKVLRARFNSMPLLDQRGFRAFTPAFHKLKNLEELHYWKVTFFTPQNECRDTPHNFQKISKLKKFVLKSGAQSSWTSMTEGAGVFLPSLWRSMKGNINPKYLNLSYYKYTVSTEALEALGEVLWQLSEVREFSLQFANCTMGELELAILAEGLIKCKQIEDFSFKYIEKAAISCETIIQFIDFVAKFSSFKKLNFFFRKVTISEWEEAELSKWLIGIENMEYVLTRNSLHIYRKNQE